MKTKKTFVLIVGGGPTGITAGLHLQKFGIPHILIEKETKIKQIPKAHYYNNQTMEVWRSISHIDKCFLNETENIHFWKNFSYCLNLKCDKILGTFNNFYNKYIFKNTYYEDISPSKVTHLSQYKVLSILYNYYVKVVNGDINITRPFINSSRLKFSSYRIIKQLLQTEREREKEKEKEKKGERNAQSDRELFLRFCEYDRSELLIGYEYKRFLKWENSDKTYTKEFVDIKKNEHPNLVMTQVKNLNTGKDEIIISNYVFVADGGKSSIKKDLNINNEKRKDYMKFINIHFHSKQLSYLIKNNPAMLYFIFNEYIGVLVIHNFKEGEGVLHIPYLSEKEMKIYINKTSCLKVLDKLIGFSLSDVHIHDIYKWTMNSSISSTFVDEKTNRIILLGDAAHKLPPSGGFGLNLGIGEVSNITWKMCRIFHLKKNAFMNSLNKKKLNKIDFSKRNNSEKNNSERYNSEIEGKRVENDMSEVFDKYNQMNNIFSTLLNNDEKVKLQNFIDSYNIERKLVTEYTIDCAIKNYEKGNEIPNILGYQYKFMNLLKKYKLDDLIQNSNTVYYLFNAVKQFLNTINNIPYIFEKKQKKIHQLLDTPCNLLTLLYPEVDLGYAYINTMKKNNNDINKIEQVERNVNINNNDKGNVFEKKENKLPHLKIYNNMNEGNIIPIIVGSKIPHFIIYSFNKTHIFKMSTVDLPVINNISCAYLILLFDYTILSDVIRCLGNKKIYADKFKICLWDSNIIVDLKSKNELCISRKHSKNKTINIINDSNMESVKIRSTPFIDQQQNHLYDIAKVQGFKLPFSDLEVNLVFSSNLIKELFLKTLHLKTDKCFVIIRPDKHIISLGDGNVINEIEEIQNAYI